MPNHTNGPNGVSSQSRDASSNQKKQQDSRSINSLVSRRGNTEESQTPTSILASTSGALERLAGIVKFFESSYSYDVNMVEGVYGMEMDREKEIQRLTVSLETLTHLKSAETENLRHENVELKAEQEACQEERKRCQMMQVELEARHAVAEASRKEEFERDLREEKAKLQKHVKVKKAEIEAESKQKVRELEKQNEKLSTTNQKLETLLSTANEKLDTKKIRHARERKALEEDNEKLGAELKQVKSEFPVEVQPAQYYAEKFRQISDAVKAISSKYFQKLPERAMVNPEAIHQELSKLNPIFDSTPIWQTEVSDFLRLRDIQHVISTCICDFIWQPFFPANGLSNHQGVGPFLDAVSKSLSGFGGRSESTWRVLTLQGIDALDASPKESSQVKSTVHRVLEILRPLTVQSESAKLEEDLIDLVRNSATLWKAAQKHEAKIAVEKIPDPNGKDKWHAEYDGGFEEARVPPAGMVDTTGIIPLCLFPNVLQIASRGETTILHQGRALFADSHVFVRGMLERKEHEEELTKAVMDARSKVNARRTSFPSGPNSPTGRRFST